MINKRRNRFDRIATGCLVAMVILCSILNFVWQRVKVIEIGYDINKAEHRFSRLTRESDKLNLETFKLKSPQRIGNVSKSKLGLVVPRRVQVIEVSGRKYTTVKKKQYAKLENKRTSFLSNLVRLGSKAEAKPIGRD